MNDLRNKQSIFDLSLLPTVFTLAGPAMLEMAMTSFGAEKIKVIKEVRAITGLGLAEAKAMVEGVPAKIKEGVSKDEAEEIKGKLEAVGAKVELK